MAVNYTTKESHLSLALQVALGHVKSFMTENQKSNVLLREGKAYVDQGDLRGAIDCFNEGINFNPTVSLFTSRALSYKLLEMYKEAYFDYSYAIRLEPDNASHFCARGLCLAKMKKLGMAIEDLDIAIGLDPSSINYCARATTYAEFEKYHEAIQGMVLSPVWL